MKANLPFSLSHLFEGKEKRSIAMLRKSRIYVSRLFAVVILLLAIFTGHSFSQDSLIDLIFEISGLLFLILCSMGRFWALMYISGNKSQEVITNGPYSMVRHPLYFFSLIGAVGIGLASENLLILALIMVLYLIYYPFTIFAEEKKLENKFGEIYFEYKRKTPRFLPKLSLYRGPFLSAIKTGAFVKNFVESMWFVWIFILFHLIETAQYAGYLPVYLRVP